MMRALQSLECEHLVQSKPLHQMLIVCTATKAMSICYTFIDNQNIIVINIQLDKNIQEVLPLLGRNLKGCVLVIISYNRNHASSYLIFVIFSPHMQSLV